MTLLFASGAQLGRVKPITATNWGTNNGASPQVSAARILTVPAGNPGVIKFTSVGTSATFEYAKNAGAYAAVTEGLTVSVANGDTIQFRLTGAAFDVASCSVIDNTTTTSIGTWLSSLT